MPRKDKVIHISNLPSTFRGNITSNGRFIQNGIPPLGGAYDKVAKSTGLIRLGNEFLYNGINNLVSKDNREKLMNNTAGRLINYVKDFNKESFPSDDELGPTFPFNIIQTPRSNGKNLPQKQYAVGGKVPNVVAGGIAQPLGNNFFYMNGRKHSQGGIDIGPSDKTGIEVEGGEVVETNGNELKVYSAQPIINGVSPAKLVMGGADPNKVFAAQEQYKDRNRINDDGTRKAKYGIWEKLDKAANIGEKTLGVANLATSAATLAAPNPYTAVASYITGLGSTVIDVYQGVRGAIKGDWTEVGKNAADIGLSLIGLRALRNANKLRALDKSLNASGAAREYVTKTVGRGRGKHTFEQTKELSNAISNEAIGYFSIPAGTALNLVDTDKNKKRMGGLTHITRKKQIGGKVKPKFDDWYKTVPAEINDTTNYNLRRAYELLPYNELENWRNGKEHLRSVAPTKDGNYEFLKSKKHPTYRYEIDWYNGPDATSFRKEYLLDESTEYPTYRKRNKMGGLSRSKDYGSKKKPYPSVAKKDFAGGHRSYPIPTKADAIDALRLAGLHGRNDVKAKVYNKYPELRKKGSNGLIISISGNVKNGLLHSPSSTGGRHDKLIDGGRRTNPDSLKADRLWSDRQINKIRYLTDLRNSTRNIVVPTGYKVTDIHRTNEPGRYSLAVNIPNQDSINVNIPLRNLPASNIPKGEEYIEKLIEEDRKLNLKSDRSNYTRGYDGRVYYKSWVSGKSGEINYGTNEFYNQTRSGKNALENNRPQYYAERRLPLFEDGPAITSGLVRAGWSHGNNKNITVDNTNIPNLPTTKSKGNTPRRGRNKSSQSVQSSSTKTPPTATYNRNLPTIEASIPTTLPVSTSVPVKQSSQSDGKGQGKFKNITTADWIGLGSNIAGGLGSYFASKRAINKMRGPGRPTLISANKLKTKYNINPQLDRIREDKFEAYRDIDSNTASSRVSLARKQRVRNAAGQAANELYGNKENIETNLINQDRRNQQSVRQFNAQQYNQYIDRKAAFDNGIREAKVTNINNLFSGINAGIQDMISRYENRKALNNTISAMRASAPNVDDRIMRDAGVDYDEFIIRKRRKLGGKQSCR